MMNRRNFVLSAGALALASPARLRGQGTGPEHQFPPRELVPVPYIEEVPVPEYHWAPTSSYEAFRDMKFGVRLHWGLYSIWHRGAESWPFLPMSFEDRQKYNDLYKTWNPAGFDADQWVSLFDESGMKMFAFTSKHHEGFSMFDTKTRVRQRTNWTAAGGPKIESCDLAYSIMETPFRRDVIKELCDAAHKRNIKIDFYFSHPDWYDADFRPYVQHPLQVPSSPDLLSAIDIQRTLKSYGGTPVIEADPSSAEIKRMMERHRAQLVELLTNYGRIDMLCLDMYLGHAVWPELRKTILKLREIQPDVMLRDRGIGNYGDYYTPERVIPSTKQEAGIPWFVIYPLGSDFSYEPDPAKHKGTAWIISNLVDSVAKGGGFMVGVGPSSNGQIHPEAARQMRATGAWLKVNGEAIYATRPRDNSWSEGESMRYTRTKDRESVYAIALHWPERELLLTTVKPRPGSSIRMLGYPNPLPWTLDSARGLSIAIPTELQDPAHRPCDFVWCFKIETGNA
jgi:alpha-L-fucosidase